MQTAEVVQYILVKDQKKIPVRRAGRVSSWQHGNGTDNLFDPQLEERKQRSRADSWML